MMLVVRIAMSYMQGVGGRKSTRDCFVGMLHGESMLAL